jgi:hypothetical protein
LKPKQGTIEKLARNAYKKHSVNDAAFSLDEQIQRSGGFIVGFKEGLKECSKWQKEQDKNRYSEEELHNAFYNGWIYRGEDYSFPKAKKEWFEQFSKLKNER